jgi:hypothetical protein
MIGAKGLVPKVKASAGAARVIGTAKIIKSNRLP